ncbi:hypothetical protein TEA_003245 [Camellia sinensis var. sinensis]|uniref:Protein kinase domain-containing protein n=1 Tax=Camellia sinensis var. sinensis TaxID=542762 RepID=A0A4V6RYF8_CAMSN|nr:hypothetical protein TEA_003245 [Camellia sinensis var. sinensis]
MHLVTCACYGGSVSKCYQPPELTLLVFSISNTKNKFTAIGCDTHATIQVSGKNYFVATGCESQCSTINYIPDGLGIGCCQTSIPKGVGYMNIFLQSYINHGNVSKFNPCSYAFVVEEGAFNFSKSYLRNSIEEMMLIVLDWAVGNNKTCKDSKRNLKSYECGENSDCYESKNGPGFVCKCRIGYKGNPYLSDGCQDIKECEDPKLNMCEQKNECVDRPPRNYTCSCPEGYHSDGRTDRKGCIANQFLAIQIAVGFAIGALVVLVSSSWLYWIFKKIKLIMLKEKFFRQNGELMLKQQLSRLERSTQELIEIFNSEELKRATNNYDESRIVGRGGFGIVYKGILPKNKIVAIKKSRMVDKSQIEQFMNEVIVLSQINYRNVVKLLGCCLETQVPLLVYEFITNGTLFEHINNQSKASNISWENRLHIATETVGVLSYMHSAASIPIIHRDVKSTNILLDDNYIAKVSDFGVSRALIVISPFPIATAFGLCLCVLPFHLRLCSEINQDQGYTLYCIDRQLPINLATFILKNMIAVVGNKQLGLPYECPINHLLFTLEARVLSEDEFSTPIKPFTKKTVSQRQVHVKEEFSGLGTSTAGDDDLLDEEVEIDAVTAGIEEHDVHEIEYLLCKASTGYIVRGYRSNTTTAGVDSMAEDMLLHGGR